jgi:hypothetical protein
MQLSSAGNLIPTPPRTGGEPLDSSGSYCQALASKLQCANSPGSRERGEASPRLSCVARKAFVLALSPANEKVTQSA